MLTGRTEEAEVFQAAMNCGEEAETLLAACETIYGHGFADRVGGNVESPQGHFYMVGRWIVTTDSQGFHDLAEFENDIEAEREFDRLDASYSEWEDDEDAS